jgi:hypothetical protein
MLDEGWLIFPEGEAASCDWVELLGTAASSCPYNRAKWKIFIISQV